MDDEADDPDQRRLQQTSLNYQHHHHHFSLHHHDHGQHRTSKSTRATPDAARRHPEPSGLAQRRASSSSPSSSTSTSTLSSYHSHHPDHPHHGLIKQIRPQAPRQAVIKSAQLRPRSRHRCKAISSQATMASLWLAFALAVMLTKSPLIASSSSAAAVELGLGPAGSSADEVQRSTMSQLWSALVHSDADYPSDWSVDIINCILALLLTGLILVTAIGNLFVICAIVVERDLRTVGNYLVLSLAIADLLVACLVMPMAGIYLLLDRWTLGILLCDIWTSSDVFCCTASILHLLAIALDRYWAVTRVDYIRCQRNQSRILYMIGCVWMAAGVISLAPVFGWKDVEFERRITLHQECLLSQDIGYQIFATCTTFYCPLILTLLYYWKIYKVARKRIRRKPGNRLKMSVQNPSSSSSTTSPHPIQVQLQCQATKTITKIVTEIEPNQQQQQQQKSDSTSLISSSNNHKPETRLELKFAGSATSSTTTEQSSASAEPTPASVSKKADLPPEAELRPEVASLNMNANDAFDNRVLNGHHSTSTTGTQTSTNNKKTSPSDVEVERLATTSAKDNQLVIAHRSKLKPSHSDHLVGTPSCNGTGSCMALEQQAMVIAQSDSEGLARSSAMVAAATAQAFIELESPMLAQKPPVVVDHLSVSVGGEEEPADCNIIAASTTKLALSASVQRLKTNTSGMACVASTNRPGQPVTTKLMNPISSASAHIVQQHSNAAEALESRRERKAAKTLAIITGVFVVCWLPFFVMAILMPLLDLKPHKFLFALLLWLGYLNSMLNPIIYTIFSPDFRKAFKRLCGIEDHKSAKHGRNKHLNHTTNINTKHLNNKCSTPTNTQTTYNNDKPRAWLSPARLRPCLATLWRRLWFQDKNHVNMMATTTQNSNNIPQQQQHHQQQQSNMIASLEDGRAVSSLDSGHRVEPKPPVSGPTGRPPGARLITNDF